MDPAHHNKRAAMFHPSLPPRQSVYVPVNRFYHRSFTGGLPLTGPISVGRPHPPLSAPSAAWHKARICPVQPRCYCTPWLPVRPVDNTRTRGYSVLTGTVSAGTDTVLLEPAHLQPALHHIVVRAPLHVNKGDTE